jgi:Domain of unknown function (DUF5667)
VLTEPSPRQLEDALIRRGAGVAIVEAAGVNPAAEELEAMLRLSEEIAALPAAEADAGTRSRARDEFIQAGRDHRAAWVHSRRLAMRPAKHPLPTHGFRWTFVVGLALFLALVAGVSLALATQLAEPDSQLYELKLNSQRLLVFVNRSPVNRAGVHLQLANQRFRDTESMAAKYKGDLAVQSMQGYYDELRAAGADLASAPHDAAWKNVRNQFDSAESKPIDTLMTQLQNTRQASAMTRIKGLADQFARDRKSIDAKLNPGKPGQGGPTPQPQPLPSGAQPQPGGTSTP